MGVLILLFIIASPFLYMAVSQKLSRGSVSVSEIFKDFVPFYMSIIEGYKDVRGIDGKILLDRMNLRYLNKALTCHNDQSKVVVSEKAFNINSSKSKEDATIKELQAAKLSSERALNVLLIGFNELEGLLKNYFEPIRQTKENKVKMALTYERDIRKRLKLIIKMANITSNKAIPFADIFKEKTINSYLQYMKSIVLRDDFKETIFQSILVDFIRELDFTANHLFETGDLVDNILILEDYDKVWYNQKATIKKEQEILKLDVFNKMEEGDIEMKQVWQYVDAKINQTEKIRESANSLGLDSNKFEGLKKLIRVIDKNPNVLKESSSAEYVKGVFAATLLGDVEQAKESWKALNDLRMEGVKEAFEREETLLDVVEFEDKKKEEIVEEVKDTFTVDTTSKDDVEEPDQPKETLTLGLAEAMNKGVEEKEEDSTSVSLQKAEVKKESLIDDSKIQKIKQEKVDLEFLEDEKVEAVDSEYLEETNKKVQGSK